MKVDVLSVALLPLLILREVSCSLVSLTSFNRCEWVVDISSTKEPDRVLGYYFNEKGSFDVKDKLVGSGITDFLRPVKRGDSEGYYVFPYFILVRAECDSGFYDDSYYRIIMNGDYPTIRLRYWPETSRMAIKRSLKVSSTGALINLQPDENHLEVPINKQAPICYMDMCYPAFVVPLIFPHMPIFEVVVEAVDEFSKSTTRIYVSPFHSRKADGAEDIVLSGMGDQRKVATADQFFPRDRISDLDDTHGLTEEIVNELSEDAEYFPLDKEDFVEAQYTHGTAPVVFFAGFYKPDLVIMADPDLKDIHLIQWGRNPLFGNKSDENATIFDHGLSCNLPSDQRYFGDADYPIPYYTRGEGSLKNDWLGTYYRKRFQPMEYHKFPAPNAIYNIISMQDRILLVTNSGLVVLYGDTNGTMTVDSALKATGDEKLRKCFKIVRSARFASQESDLIVAVTYNYTEMKSYTKDQSPMTTAEDVDQEIYLGKLTNEGKPIEWIQVGETAGTGSAKEADEEPRSQTKAICTQAIDEYFTLDKYVEIQQCVVIDASPVSGLKDTIQLMVEMVILHVPTMMAFLNESDKLKLIEREAFLTFYIMAQYTPLETFSKQFWKIVSILPRRPCIEYHKQSVQTIENFDTNTYFVHQDESAAFDVDTFKRNCHYRLRYNMRDDLHLKRMVYTRQNDGQLFLYGNNFVHSNNKGVSFANMPGFPPGDESANTNTAVQDFIQASEDKRDEKYDYAIKLIRRHVIVVMAFSDGPYYAFLTSRRHLFFGSTGTWRTLRLRPAPGWNIMRTVLSSTPGLHDGRPFSIIFDSENKLYELVAVVNSNKEVVDIRKREARWELITQSTNFIGHLRGNVKQIVEGSSSIKAKLIKNVFHKGNTNYKRYCPYGDAKMTQNYTASLSRMMHISIQQPMQHKFLGTAATSKTLMAFQASAYSLIHNTYLNVPEETFSRIADDPLTNWANTGRIKSETGFFKYFLGDPNKYGIMVDPSSFKRLDTDQTGPSNIWVDRYILDYNQVIKIEMTFAVTVAAQIDPTDYRVQRLSRLQMTVDNANGTILSVETERKLHANRGVVSFLIYLSLDKEKANLPQDLPGMNPTIVPIAFHFIKSFEDCTPMYSGTYIGDHVHTSIYAGCPPTAEMQLNWNSTLRSMRFRNPDKWMGQAGECYGDEPVCFFVKLPLVFYFDIFDSAKQNYVPYEGRYTLRVVGGGYSKDSIKEYTEEEQDGYNVPGKSDISLIWSEWDQVKNKKVKAKREYEDLDAEDVVLVAGKSAIKWTCHAMSPCATVLPTWQLFTVYYFRIRISNRGVDKDTLCLYERDFVIQLYGFHPSPEMQLLISALFCLFNLALLYVMYFCCRNNRRVWRANKLKMYGWLQIILDTVPTSKTYSDTSKELSEQMRRDEIIMSLRGHLKVPEGIQPSKPREPTVKKRLSRVSLASEHSSTSSLSSSSDESHDDLKIQGGTLPNVHPRHAPATWTDMIYDQVITNRLNAIIERNDKMKEAILRKVDMTDALNIPEDAEDPDQEAPKDK